MTSLFQTSASTRLKASPGVRGVPAAFLFEPTGVVPLEDSKDARCNKQVQGGSEQAKEVTIISCKQHTNLDPLLRCFLGLLRLLPLSFITQLQALLCQLFGSFLIFALTFTLAAAIAVAAAG